MVAGVAVVGRVVQVQQVLTGGPLLLVPFHLQLGTLAQAHLCRTVVLVLQKVAHLNTIKTGLKKCSKSKTFRKVVPL